MKWYTVTDDTDNNALDDHRLLVEIDPDRFEVLIFRQQPDYGTLLPVALDRHLIPNPGDHYLPATNFRRAVHGDQVTIGLDRGSFEIPLQFSAFVKI